MGRCDGFEPGSGWLAESLGQILEVKPINPPMLRPKFVRVSDLVDFGISAESPTQPIDKLRGKPEKM